LSFVGPKIAHRIFLSKTPKTASSDFDNTPSYTHTDKRKQNLHQVSKLPKTVQEIGNKILLPENKFVYLNQEEITGVCDQRTCETSVQFSSTWKVDDGGKLNE